MIGVWRRFRNVDEVLVHVFCVYSNNNDNLKHEIMKKQLLLLVMISLPKIVHADNLSWNEANPKLQFEQSHMESDFVNN
jgi:hypothetical protein